MVTRKAIYTWKLSWILLLNILHSSVEAGPAKRSGRTTREVYPEIEPENDGSQGQVCIVGDVVYTSDELVPAEQPCLKCRCQPPGVQCETIKCVKKSGCRAIHRPNKCCPDYQCECYHEGKIYGNGERLKTPPGGECRVCYCRGGEVQCAKVTCYIRTDCEGKTVPGQCCPKYDHCPPKEPLTARTTTESTTIIHNSTTMKMINKSTQTDFTDDSAKQQIEQPKITIHEIIPEIKEIPMTVPSKLDESKDLVAADTNNNDVDPEPDSSEISEVFQQPPPVLRIGDKLLFLKQGELVPEKDASTPASVITIIGAEGLQRGFEDSAELLHEVTVNNNNYENGLFNNNSDDLEPKTSESTHILSLVKKKSSVVETIREETDNSTVVEESKNNTVEPADEATESTKMLILQINNAEESTNATRMTPDAVAEENPAYPAIPEDVEHYRHSEDMPKTTNPKRTPEDDQTPSQNTTLDDRFSRIEDTTTESPFSASDHSIESMEETTEEESGESTTPKEDHASVVSEEDASVEPSGAGTLESVDMLKEINPTSFQPLDDVEMIQNKTEEVEEGEKEEDTTPTVKDVEMINVDNLTRVDTDVRSGKIQLETKSIDKRESSRQEDVDEIFRELEAELNADSTERTQTAEEEKEESDRIFQELLEETSTPRTAKNKEEDKKAETLRRVTDTIARLTLRGSKNSYDTNILGLISDFFGSQSGQRKK